MPSEHILIYSSEYSGAYLRRTHKHSRITVNKMVLLYYISHILEYFCMHEILSDVIVFIICMAECLIIRLYYYKLIPFIVKK